MRNSLVEGRWQLPGSEHSAIIATHARVQTIGLFIPMNLLYRGRFRNMFCKWLLRRLMYVEASMPQHPKNYQRREN